MVPSDAANQPAMSNEEGDECAGDNSDSESIESSMIGEGCGPEGDVDSSEYDEEA